MQIERYKIDMGSRGGNRLITALQVGEGIVVNTSSPVNRYIDKSFSLVKDDCEKYGWKLKLISTQEWN